MSIEKGRILFCSVVLALVGLLSDAAFVNPKALGRPLAQMPERCPAEPQPHGTCTSPSPDGSADAAIAPAVDIIWPRRHAGSRLWHVADDETARKDSPYVPSGYVKVFGDDFTQTKLDFSRWWTRYI